MAQVVAPPSPRLTEHSMGNLRVRGVKLCSPVRACTVQVQYHTSHLTWSKEERTAMYIIYHIREAGFSRTVQ